MQCILSRLTVILGLMLALSSVAQAEVTITGTRIIFPGGQNETSVKLTNVGALPALVQNWIDNGHAGAATDQLKVPFVISPPIARIEPHQDQLLRVDYTGSSTTLPNNRESIFWFNMLDVPPKSNSKGNTLQFAVRTRIKLFYRPANLPGSSEQAMHDLQWTVVPQGKGYALRASNALPYYVSLSSTELKAGGRTYKVDIGMDDLVPPLGNHTFAIQGLTNPLTAGQVIYHAINDYGGSESFTGSLANH